MRHRFPLLDIIHRCGCILKLEEDDIAAGAYGGMTPDELRDYTVAFGAEATPKFKNLPRDEACYVPMLEVIDYLLDNDFTFCVVTGSDRTVARALVDGMIDIPPRQAIGSDSLMVATGQGGTDGLQCSCDAPGPNSTAGE